MLPIVLVREAFVSGCELTVDKAAFATLEDNGGTAFGYGVLRKFGSVGLGLASLIASLVVDAFFEGNLVYILYSQLFLGAVVVSIVGFGLDLSSELFTRQNERKKESGVVLDLILGSPRAMFCAALYVSLFKVLYSVSYI